LIEKRKKRKEGEGEEKVLLNAARVSRRYVPWRLFHGMFSGEEKEKDVRVPDNSSVLYV